MTVTSAACSYCGLPVAASPSDPRTAYCCFGCRLAAGVVAADGHEGQTRWTLTRLGVGVFFSMNVMVFTLAMWTQTVYTDPSLASERGRLLLELYQYTCLLLTTPVLLLLGGPLLENVFEQVSRRQWTADGLIAIGVVAAFGYSVVSVVRGGSHVYFETVCMILVAVTLGRWLEAVGKQRAMESLHALERLLPVEVRVAAGFAVDSPKELDGASTGDLTVTGMRKLSDVQPGDVIRVLCGERIAVDGLVLSGWGSVDQQLLTGESDAVVKRAGDPVYAGALNLDGDLFIQATAPPDAGALQRIVDSVRSATWSGSKLQSMANRAAAVFVPTVLLLAIGVFSWQAFQGAFIDGLLTALSVLLIACPCALGVATPMAIHAALAAGARRGLIIRNGDVLERLGALKAIAFDKTGTLTTGEPQLDAFHSTGNESPEHVLRIAASLASASTHRFSVAIHEAARQSLASPPTKTLADTQLELLPIADVQTVGGRGVAGWSNDLQTTVRIGSPQWMEACQQSLSPELSLTLARAAERPSPAACVAWGGYVRGVFVFREQLREEAADVIAGLQADGFSLLVLTGDISAGAAIAQSLRIPYRSGLLPDQKLKAIEQLRLERGVTAMIGDGVNDAPALAVADVGVAMGTGADVSREAADVCLIRDNLNALPELLTLAAKTRRTIRQNLAWAFAYNSIGVVLAMNGLLNPIWAAIAMVGSSLFVVSNSLRLANDEPTGQMQQSVTATDTPRRIAGAASTAEDQPPQAGSGDPSQITNAAETETSWITSST